MFFFTIIAVSAPSFFHTPWYMTRCLVILLFASHFSHCMVWLLSIACSFFSYLLLLLHFITVIVVVATSFLLIPLQSLYETVFSQPALLLLFRLLQHSIYFVGMHTIWVTYMDKMCKLHQRCRSNDTHITSNYVYCSSSSCSSFMHQPPSLLQRSLFFFIALVPYLLRLFDFIWVAFFPFVVCRTEI